MTLSHLAWYWPLIGGALIGTAAGAYLILLGRVAGVSGLLAKTLGMPGDGGRGTAALFLAGLALASGFALAVRPIPLPVLSANGTVVLVVAGLLVGYGTRLGAGCTSGHGVCGLGRASPRSVVATCVFMLMGIATATLVRIATGGTA
ncbi:YeeE/YedE family protein [Stenotrophomonas maltophilia]|uniref:YeeE/YedE family protein n=1 Tax=Stenotrophomonas TaxID=40323 RepID=UPI0021CA50CD|nr:MULTISPECIES: YeeE/YedE family protein [Stenotrophomonas]MCU0999650.1 YeeE/YedE family protein [Stenotrophomonas maltophilia]